VTVGQLRLDGDRRAVRFERHYETTIEDLWEAVSNPDRLRRWLGEPVLSGDPAQEWDVCFAELHPAYVEQGLRLDRAPQSSPVGS